MSLSVGIVGLPNVGKSTLFNALLKQQTALAANYPFATVEPNKGIAQVPDQRLEKIAQVWADNNNTSLPPIKFASIEFIDIAGLVAGASKGEGLGNKFLANIRECDLICHVLRAFDDKDVVLTGKMNPLDDLETIRTELILKDMETVKKNQGLKVKDKNEKQLRDSVFAKLIPALNAGKMANVIDFTNEELEVVVKPLSLLTTKPEIFTINVSEDDLNNKDLIIDFAKKINVDKNLISVVSAKIESELIDLEPDERVDFLNDLGIKNSGLESMALAAYNKLDLISFLTVGEIEAKAWTIKKGMTAPQAAGVIHTDFAKHFIKAKIINWQEFVQASGWKKASELGKIRQEGKNYIMQDGDVVEFMIGK